MTNPNDIIDAYEELVRLTDILGHETVQQLVNRVAGRHVVQAPILVPAPTIAAEAEPATTVDTSAGCPWCPAEVTKNTLLRHVNRTHRDDLEQLYVEDGTKGIQDTFGLSYGTAWHWASKIDGEAA